MEFKTTLTIKNINEFVKSWDSTYQGALFQLRKKQENTDKENKEETRTSHPGMIYLLALLLGYVILGLGLDIFSITYFSIELLLGAFFLFFIAFNITYALRPKWFRSYAKRHIFPKGTVTVSCNSEGLSYQEQGSDKSAAKETFWRWQELTKVIPFARTLVMYNQDCDSFKAAKGHVLFINKEDLSEDQWKTLNETYIKPLKIENKFRPYYSYADIAVFLILCLIIVLAVLPFRLA